MSADLGLAVSLVDELESLGARFSFFLDEDDQIGVAWLCQGVSNFQRCRTILALGLAHTDFVDAFQHEIEDRYLAGRLRIREASA